MATRAERQRKMEQYSDTDWEELAHRLGDVRLEVPPEKRIKEILDAAERSGSSDEYDRVLGLPTDAQQQLDLQRKALATSESSRQASWLSAHATWIGVVIASALLIVAIITLVVMRTK